MRGEWLASRAGGSHAWGGMYGPYNDAVWSGVAR
jgi:hypothetical protein